MSRKSKTVVIQSDRDAGKVFLITEMPASQAEKWGIRAAAVVIQVGFDMPEEAGWNALLAAGFQAFLQGPWAQVEPLLDEVFACVQAVPDPGVPERTRSLVESDIEEIATRIRLRDEVFELHSGFSVAASLSNLGLAASKTKTSSGIQTSDETPAP